MFSQHFKQRFAFFVASVGYSGKISQKMPGTVGTFVAYLIWWFVLADLSLGYQSLAILFSLAIGVWSSHIVQETIGTKDPSVVVIDELVGSWIALILLPKSLLWVILSFITFRLLDIYKPLFIGWIDKNLNDGWGIMLDDVLAGLLSLLIVYSLFRFI